MANGRVWFGRALLVVGSPLVLLAAVELGAWVVGVEPLRTHPAYETFEKSRRCQLGGNPDAWCRADKVATRRGVVAVGVLGGSSVRGYPKGMQAFPVRMQRQLDEVAPGGYRVFNFGLYCKDSIFVERCVQQLAPRVDALVVYMGHNDIANFMGPSPRFAMWTEKHAWVLDVQEKLAGTRLYTLLLTWGADGGEPLRSAWRPMPPAAFDRAKRAVIAGFEERVQSIVYETAGTRTPLLLVTTVSNLYESPRQMDEWDEWLAMSALLPNWQRWRVPFERGVERHRAGDAAAALQAFREARDVLLNGRAPTEMNEILRAASGRSPHVHLVDFERKLEEIAAAEGIGCNFFGEDAWCDQFHPNGRTHELIATEVVTALRELRAAGAIGPRKR